MHRKSQISFYNLYRKTPSSNWLEGIPCGNGHEGTMAFGNREQLFLSLDRIDLWYKGSKRQKHRINAGCLELPSNGDSFEEGLDIYTATAFRNTGAYHYKWFTHALKRLICVSINTNRMNEPFSLRWHPPELWSSRDADLEKYILGLEPGASARIINPYEGLVKSVFRLDGKSGVIELFVEAILHFRIRLVAISSGKTLKLNTVTNGFEVKNHNGCVNLLITLDTSLQDLDDKIPYPVPDFEKLSDEHTQWWEKYWNGSYINVNHKTANRYWHIGRYLAGSTLRSDSIPVPLQGVWGEASPPWNGAYTWDLNVQACYWPVCASGSADTILALAKWFNERLDVFENNARKVFNTEGTLLTLCTDFDGNSYIPLNSKISISHGIWACHVLWQYYRYTGNRDYLAQYCLKPFTGHMKLLQVVWKKYDGKYYLEASESPELEMLISPDTPCCNSSYDIAFSRFLALRWIEISKILALKKGSLYEFALDFLANCPSYPESSITVSNYYWPENPTIPEYYVEWEKLETEMSHRHLSHLVNVYPLEELHANSDANVVRKLKNTMQRLQARGIGSWEPFTFGWASIINTRLGWRPRYSMNMLEIMNQYMTVPFNGIPVCDDYLSYGLFNQTGPYGPKHLGAFSLESIMITMAAVQEAVVYTINGTTRFCEGFSEDIEGEFHEIILPGGRKISGNILKGKKVTHVETSDA